MIHASGELVEAMAGRGGTRVGADYRTWACAPSARIPDNDEPGVYSWIGSSDHWEDRVEVTCPACLELMRAARGPVSRPFVIVADGQFFWRPRRCGYSTSLLLAGLYSEDEARAQERARPAVDRAVPLAEALEEFGAARVNPAILAALTSARGAA